MLNSGQVRVAGTGELHLAPYIGGVAPTLPTSAAAVLDAAFKGFGYTTEDGTTLSKSIEREGVPAWQSSTPVRYLTTGQEFTVATTFLQSNKDTLKAWLTSGDFAPDGNVVTPGFRADVPVDPESIQFALVLDWQDGSIKSRLVVGKVEITETGDVSLARQATAFGMTFGALAPNSGNVLASWMTTDPAFNPA